MAAQSSALKRGKSLAPARRNLSRWLAAGAAVLLALAGWLLYRPVNPDALLAPAQPAASYAEATQRIQALQERAAGVAMHPTLQAAGLPDHGYPRYATRALAHVLHPGQAVEAEARRQPPAAQALVVVTNDNDDKVNNTRTGHVVELWRSHGANVRTYEFPAALGLTHDLIEPEPPNAANTALVYARLIELVEP